MGPGAKLTDASDPVAFLAQIHDCRASATCLRKRLQKTNVLLRALRATPCKPNLPSVSSALSVATFQFLFFLRVLRGPPCFKLFTPQGWE